MTGSRRRPRLWQLLALLTAALLVSAGLAEGLYRALRSAPFAPPRIVYPDGRVVPLAEIAAMVTKSGEGSNMAGPHGRIQPHLDIKLCYDRTQWRYFDPDGCVEVRTNSLGFRDDEFPAAKPAGELRIVAIGDSFTFGSGVQQADTWPQQLEAMLRQDRAREGMGPVQVINAGYAAGEDSYWPPGYAAWLETDGLGFAPDIVVLGFCLNDVHLGIPMMHACPPAMPQPWLGGYSALLYSFQQAAAQRELEQQFEQQLAGPYSDYALTLVPPTPEQIRQLGPVEVARRQEWRDSWERSKAACREIRDAMAAADVRFVLAIFPMLSYLNDRYPYRGIHDLVREFCEAEHIEYVDLFSQFRGRDETRLWVHPTDQHPNDVGQELIAEGIRAFLRGD